MTIHQILNAATKKLNHHHIPSANLDAEVLLLEALNKSRGTKFCAPTFLYSYPEYQLNKNEEKVFNDFISRRLKREPVAYIVGHKEFFGLNFIVNKSVLIPRPETEIIVEEVLKIVGAQNLVPLPPQFNLIDVGTGSGCVAISILCRGRSRPAPTIKNNYALDISKEAIKIAKQNAEIILGKNHKIKFIAGDFSKTSILCKGVSQYAPTPRDLIITANLPYLSENNYQQTQPEIKNFEPKIALAAKENGLALIKKLLQKIAVCRGGSRPAPTSKSVSQYAPTVFIFLEIDPSQAKDILEFVKNIFPFSKTKIIRDLAGKDRVVKIILT